MTYVGPTVLGSPQRPFQGSIWGTPLPANATIDPNSTNVVASLAAQAAAPNGTPNLNVSAWTAEPYVVPASQPLVPVSWTGGSGQSQLQAVLQLGVPIPPGTRPTNDSDAALIFWQPDYVSPKLSTNYGRYYELHKATVLLDANGNALLDSQGREQWSANGGGRMTGVNTDIHGHYGNWTASGEDPGGYATDPDSTYELAGWGVQGSGLPYLPGVVTYEDCVLGHIDHAVHLVVAHAAPGHVWPAQKYDGDDNSTLVVEGQRFRLAPGYYVGGVHPICAMLIEAAWRYGIVITDKSAVKGQTGNLGFRAAPSIAPFLNGTPSYQVLNGFPWSHLQLLAQGSDSNPTPTS